MKKMLLLFFALLSLGLGHGTAVGMDIDLIAITSNDVKKAAITMSNDSLAKGLSNLILSKWDARTAKKIRFLMNEIAKRPDHDLTFTDPNILAALIKDDYHAIPDWIKWFLNHGIPVDGLDRDGYTALMTSVVMDRADIAQILLAHGANRNIRLTIKFRDTSPFIEAQKRLNTNDKKEKAQEILVLMSNYPHPTSAPAPSTASTSSTASTATEPRTPHNDRRLVPASTSIPAPAPSTASTSSTASTATAQTAGVRTEFPTPPPADRSSLLTPRVVNGHEVRNLTPQELEPILIMINNKDKEASFYENIITSLYQRVNFNSYVKRNDGSNTYINPIIYALDKNNAHGLEWVKLFSKNNSTILQNILYPTGAYATMDVVLKDTPLSPEARTWLQSQGVKIQQPQMPTLPSFQWNTAKAKIAAVVAALSFSGIFYRWWMSGNTKQHTQNVLINNTGADIFVGGSDEPIVPKATYELPATGIVEIKLNRDQDDAKDLKINMTDYAQDMQDSYLNLSIRKKWFANWFTVPLTATQNWVQKQESAATE